MDWDHVSPIKTYRLGNSICWRGNDRSRRKDVAKTKFRDLFDSWSSCGVHLGELGRGVVGEYEMIHYAIVARVCAIVIMHDDLSSRQGVELLVA